MTRFRSVRSRCRRLNFTLRIRVEGAALCDLETGQEFAVTVRSEDRRFNDAYRTYSQTGGKGGDLFDDALLRRLVAHNAAFPDLFAPDFKLRFDEGDHECGFPNQWRNYGKDFAQ